MLKADEKFARSNLTLYIALIPRSASTIESSFV